MDVKNIPLNVLSAVRQNFGAKDENDASHDYQIEQLSIMELIERYSCWHLGSGGWGKEFVGIYKTLKDANVLEGEK